MLAKGFFHILCWKVQASKTLQFGNFQWRSLSDVYDLPTHPPTPPQQYNNLTNQTNREVLLSWRIARTQMFNKGRCLSVKQIKPERFHITTTSCCTFLSMLISGARTDVTIVCQENIIIYIYIFLWKLFVLSCTQRVKLLKGICQIGCNQLQHGTPSHAPGSGWHEFTSKFHQITANVWVVVFGLQFSKPTHSPPPNYATNNYKHIKTKKQTLTGEQVCCWIWGYLAACVDAIRPWQMHESNQKWISQRW